jgi:hypothetical protein
VEKVKLSCQCCPNDIATHVYEMFTVKASIFFCDLHLPFFKQCSGEIREIKKNEKLEEKEAPTKAEAKEISKLLAAVNQKT